MVLLLLSCAEVAPPPGGEIDSTGPCLIGSEPPNGAVDVAPGRTVTLYFSENIARPKKGKAVYVSPRPQREPKIAWKSDHIRITLPAPFEEDQTYIVSAGSEIEDLRGNKLDSSLTVAFSTGPTIDSGHVAGRVVSANGAPKSGLLVALYDLSATDVETPLDSLYGDYVTQSNQDGFFSFQYLPAGEYRLIAYEDGNRSERFNSDREPFAVPDRPVIIGGELPLDSLVLTMSVVADTTVPEILSAGQTPDGLVRIRLSGKINLNQLKQNAGLLLLTSLEDTLETHHALAMLETDEEESSTISFHPGPFGDGAYSVVLTYDTTMSLLSYSEVVFGPREDQTTPRLMRFSPGSVPQFKEEIAMEALFSESLDTSVMTGGTFVLWETPETRIPLTWRWSDPLRLTFSPDSITPGAAYRLEMTEFELADAAGNRLGDSLREFSFTVIADDSLGWISGKAEVAIPGKEGDPVLLTLSKTGSPQVYDLTVPGKEFKMRVPAGKYVVSGFVDSDHDGKRGNGSIDPFRLAETRATFADTIAVRARFETAGVEFLIR